MIIEQKQGTGTGEFGFRRWEGEPEWPTSFVLNSKGEICILDHLNNRIQIFSNSGKYLNSIPIESYKSASEEEIEESMKTWNPIGFDFATIAARDLYIDKDDNFYLDQHRMNVKPGGETIRETRRIKHTKTGKRVFLSQEKLEKIALLQDQNQGLFIELGTGKSQIKEKYQIKLMPKATNTQNVEIQNLKDNSTKTIQLKFERPYSETEFVKTDKNGNIYIFTRLPHQIRKYNLQGKILSILNVSSTPRIDKEGNIYQMELLPDPQYPASWGEELWLLKVIKWEVKKR
ncbi:MAG: hypothetical protein AB1595_07260 [bacterium]